MKLIKPKVEILDELDGQAILERIEQVARTCYKSEDKITKESAQKLVKHLIESKHEAMLEFFDITVKFTCSRSIAQEITRHRMSSFAMESQRFCGYNKDKFGGEITFIIPSWLTLPEGQYKWEDQNPLLTAGMSIEEAGYDDSSDLWIKDDMRDGYVEYKRHYKDWMATERFMHSLQIAEDSYLDLIRLGLRPQCAREVLPNATKTELNMKANLREWRHFFELRCSTAAHPDMRVLALDLLKQMHEKVPVIFDDLYEKFYGDKRSKTSTND